MTLKEIRKNCKLTQKQASDIVGMPLRTYVGYENNELESDQLKLERVKEKLLDFASKDTSILNNKVLFAMKNKGYNYDYIVVDQFAKPFVYFSYLKTSPNVVKNIIYND